MAGVLCLLLATAAAVGFSRPGAQTGQQEAETPAAPAAAEARQALRQYFAAQYREAECSAIYADLTHDGVEELLVLEMDGDRLGEPVQLHGGRLDPDRFTAGEVTVLWVEEDGSVRPLYSFTCSSAHAGWGELYLQKRDGRDYLLHYAPYTSTGRSDFQLVLFSLAEDGTPVEAERLQAAFAAGEAPLPEEDAAEAAAFFTAAEALLEGAKPLLVYDVIHDPLTGADGPRLFAYLDELFTTF